MNSYLLISLAAVLGGFALWIIYRGLASTVRDSSRASQDMAARLDEQIRAVQREVKDTLAASHAQQLLQLQDSQRILNESLGERLEKSSQNIHRQLAVVPEVQKKLGELEEQARNMARMGREISQLGDLLKPPKLRGGLGEIMLNNLLGDVLPGGVFQTQHTFRDGTRVDAIVRCHKLLLPIDSKFPLDSYRRLSTLGGDPTEAATRKQFERELRSHIDKVSSYIKPHESTTDIALLYLPSEAVYAEIANGSGADSALFEYAFSKSVILASPSLTYIYLRAIAAALQGFEVAQQSKEILNRIVGLRSGFSKLQLDFERVGVSLRQAAMKYDTAQKRFDSFNKELDSASTLSQASSVADVGESEIADIHERRIAIPRLEELPLD